MEQKKRKSSRRTGAGGSQSNVNMRSVSNSREVSRRSKGRSRYAYEDDRRPARYYDDDEYYTPRKKKPAKSAKTQKRAAAAKGSAGGRSDGSQKYRRRRRRNKMGFSKILGIIMCIVQFVLSVVLAVNVIFFDMLPPTYVLVLAGVLAILLGITLLSQLGAKGKGILGKAFCLFLCVIMGGGSFYIGKINNAFQDIMNNGTQTNSVVVAVLKDDKAKDIKDALDYNFGVQYTINREQIESTVRQIEKETGDGIETTEFGSLAEEVQALYDGKIEAVIYNPSYASVLGEQYATFSNDVRVIYKHSIVTAIENNGVEADMGEPFAVYLSGIDQWDNPEQNDTGRSDVNIVAVVNPQSHQVLLVSTPRDFYVPIPGISQGERDKLTHAGIYGVEASMATLGELYETEIPFYGRVNFSTMIRIVDALGGLDVESDAEFDTGPETGVDVHVNQGMNHFNGEEALAFCRERHALADGDNARGRHQQAVITAIIKKMMSPAMLRGATEILQSVSDGVQTNFNEEQIQSLIKTQLRTNAEWHISSVSAVGTGDKQACYSSGSQLLYVTWPDDASVENIIDLINRVEAGEVLDGLVEQQEPAEQQESMDWEY